MEASALTIGGIVLAGVVLLEVIKIMLTKMISGKEHSVERDFVAELKKHLDDIRKKASDIHHLVHERDPDGTPLIYSPRRAIRLQEEQLEESREIKTILRELLLLTKKNGGIKK